MQVVCGLFGCVDKAMMLMIVMLMITVIMTMAMVKRTMLMMMLMMMCLVQFPEGVFRQLRESLWRLSLRVSPHQWLCLLPRPGKTCVFLYEWVFVLRLCVCV
jgi:hypothetical protein